MTSSPERPTRRRAITILAAAAAGALVGGPARSSSDYRWSGVAMGADATILFNGIDRDTARAAIELVEAEIERLEGALSLFRQDSELCRLNRDRFLQSPSADFRRALTLAIDMAAASGGLFDPTVQALWEAYVDWFAAAPNAATPPEELIARARTAVDWRGVRIEADAIGLGQGQRVTLNGLGQGYVTDRIAELLAGRGLKYVLVDLGEQRAMEPRLDGNAWQIARADQAPIALRHGALATSEGAGCVLGARGAVHHLFDPRSGRSAAHWKALTVHHRSAAVADALSTAFYIASADEIAALLPGFPGTVMWSRDHANIDRRWIAAPANGARQAVSAT
jgi:thiamine biosynthesis lipoprotein